MLPKVGAIRRDHGSFVVYAASEELNELLSAKLVNSIGELFVLWDYALFPSSTAHRERTFAEPVACLLLSHH